MRRLIERPLGPLALWAAAVVASVAMVLLGFALVYRIEVTHEFQEQSYANCQQIENLKAAITDVLVDSRTASLSRSGLSAAELRLIRTYYQRQLARFAAAECMAP